MEDIPSTENPGKYEEFKTYMRSMACVKNCVLTVGDDDVQVCVSDLWILGVPSTAYEKNRSFSLIQKIQRLLKVKP